MKSNLFVLAVVGLFVTIPATALAQKSYALGIGGGAAVPTGKFSDTQSAGYDGTAFIAIGVPELPIGARFDITYNKFPHKGAPSAPASPNSDIRAMGLIGNLIYAFPGTTAKPYLVAGGGLYNTKADSAGAKSKNNFGYNAGVGVTFGLGALTTFLETRYHSISRKQEEGGNIQFVPITFGLMF